MKNKILILVAFLVFIIQSTLMQKFRFLDIIPNLPIIILIFLIIKFPSLEVLKFSLTLGFLQDLYLSQFIGINIFIYCILVFFIKKFENGFNEVNIASPLFLIAIATIFYHIVSFIFYYFLGFNFSLLKLIDIVIVEMLLNLILGSIIFICFKFKIIDTI